MPSSDPVVIVGAARTPMGGLQGDFASLGAPQLGSAAIRAAVERSGLAKDDIEEVVMGCVLPGRAGPGAGPPGGAAARACPTPPAAPPSTRCAARA